ncbi:MAG: cytochrome c [Tepidisphaera sp.]
MSQSLSRLSSTFLAVVLAGFVGSVVSCSSQDQPAAQTGRQGRAPIPLPALSDATAKDYPGIHNAVAFHEGYVSGSVPEGQAGFETLAAMGIRTIISVDGAAPDVEAAKALGMRYIHLPIGYNGFNEQRKLELVRASRDALAQGPVYIHCHHGKHRSAGAAATVAASLGWSTPDQGVARMKVSGTAPNYKGLYSCATTATVLSASTIDAVPGDFPAVDPPKGLVKAMVEIDEVFEHLKSIEKAAWKAPSDHPDLVPAAEAGRLADHYRLLVDDAYTRRKPAEFKAFMERSRDEAQALEDLLGAATPDPIKLAAQSKLIAASCKECHTKYRD